MNGDRKIRVALAGPYPHTGGMKGTYGRILDHLRESTVFSAEVEFIPHRVTLPVDGNIVRRFGVDLVRFLGTMRRKPDILHFIMQKYRALYREFPMLKLAKALGLKTIVDVRAGTLQYMLARKGYGLQNAMMNNLLRYGDVVLLECKKDVGFVRERYGREGVYMPNAVRETDFRRIKPTSFTPQNDQPLRLIYSGRYSEEKGISVILKSVDELAARGRRVELHLTGQGTEPATLQMIQAYVQNPPQGTRVVDHGWDVPDLYALLATAQVFVMPTVWRGEGHPNSVTEAMMAGHGLILSDWSHREDIVPDEGVVIIPPEDPNALADAVEKCLQDPALLARAGQINRAFAKDHYLDVVCYPRLLDLYKRLVHTGP